MKRNLLTFGTMALLISVGGCGDTIPTTVPGECSLDFASPLNATFDNGKVDRLLESAATFNIAATSIDTDVRAACNAIATDLGASTATDTEMACANAKAAIDTIITANASATLSVEFTPPVCTVSASAVATCAAECDVNFDASATPVTCDGGMLSGTCSGMCTGTCDVQASASCSGSCSASCTGTCTATVDAACTGTCMGQCDGTCETMDGDGNCMGACDGMCRGMCDGTIEGSCSGSCEGSCSGSCRVEATASCEGSCTGMCDVAFTAPRCEGGEVSVMAEADCQASCEADASVQAECTEPNVVVSFTGSATSADDLTALSNTLKANLGTLLAAIQRGELAVSAGVEFASSLGGAVSAAGEAGIEAASCLAVAVDTQVAAAAKFNVSVMASVEVSGSATGSTR